MKKALLLAMTALVSATMMTGCIGGKNGFALAGNIYDWNCSASSERWVNEVIFLGMSIFYVYGISLLADAIIFNSIDFWTGENPLASTSGTDAEGNMYAIVPNADGTATLTYKGQSCTLTRDGNAVTMSKDGATIGSFTAQGSLVTFTHVDGTTQSVLR